MCVYLCVYDYDEDNDDNIDCKDNSDHTTMVIYDGVVVVVATVVVANVVVVGNSIQTAVVVSLVEVPDSFGLGHFI